MIQFNLSQELKSVMGAPSEQDLDKSSVNKTPTMIWFAHLVKIQGVQCIITVEQHTRYVMVFCGLSNNDLMSFHTIFQDRLWREVFAICQEGNENIIHHLAKHIIDLGQKQEYEMDYDRSVYSLMRLVVADLESRVFDHNLALPVDCGDAFEFGVEINNALRNLSDNQLKNFTPIESFKRQCLGLLDDVVPMSLFAKNSLSAMARYLGEGQLTNRPEADREYASQLKCSSNVIEVDFLKRKKKNSL